MLKGKTLLAGLVCSAGLCSGLAQPVAAQSVVTGEDARGMLFAPRGARVVVYNLPGLSDTVKAAIGEQFKGVQYYGAFAMSLDGSEVVGAQASANLHSVASAERAALAACNGSVPAGSPPCRIAAQVQPPGYSPQPLTLSLSATEGFEDSYVDAGPPKAFAISPSTGEWSIASGQGAGATALASCNRAASTAGDCRVVIGD